MDAEFLEHTVKEALTEGLSSTVAARPEDPVDYLGNYLLQYANRIEAEERLRKEDEQYEQEKSEYESKLEQQKEEAQKHEDERKQVEEERKEIESLLEQCDNVDQDILEKVINLVQKRTGATGVYVAKKEANAPFETEGAGGQGGDEEGEGEEAGAAGGGEEEEEETAQHRLRYIAASSGHEHLLDKWISEKEGTTFKAWVMPEAAEGEEEEEEEEAEEEEEEEGKEKEAKPEPELPTINVEDAVQDPDVKFFGIPKLGGFAAVPIRYKSLTHEEALPEITVEQRKGEEEEGEEGGGEEEEEGEEGEEGKEEEKEESKQFQVPPGNAIEEDIAICFDAVGQNRSFEQNEIDYVKHLARLLRDAYNRAEQKKYEEEYKKAYEHKIKMNDPPEGLNEDLEAEASAVEEEKSGKTAELEEEAPEDKTQLIEAVSNQSLAVAKLKVYEKYDFLSCIYNSRIPPSSDAIKVLQSVFYTLQYDKAGLGNPNALDKLTFSWETVRSILQDGFISKLEQYDVNSVDTSDFKNYQKSDSIKAVIEGIDKESVGSASPIFPLLVDWVNAVLSGRDAVEKKRQREQEEAEKAAAAAAEGDEENKEEGDEEEED